MADKIKLEDVNEMANTVSKLSEHFSKLCQEFKYVKHYAKKTGFTDEDLDKWIDKFKDCK